MKPPSFRLKIALLAGLISGLLLVGTSAVLWRVAYRLSLEQVDREIRNLGQANLERVLGGDHWERLEAALRFVSARREGADFILWVRNNHNVAYRSPGWPSGLDPAALEVSPHYASPGGPRPGDPLPPPPRRGEEISPRNPALPLKQARFQTVHAGGRDWRIGVMGNPYVVLVLGADLAETTARMAELRHTFLVMLPLAFALVRGGSWFLARRALRPVQALTEAAERVTAQGLDRRLPVSTRDREFNRLITVFNDMLDRLERSFRQANRFSADASHELKTPLARLQLELEEALEQAPDGSEQQALCGSLLEEVTHLKAIVQKLLLLALADAGQLQLRSEPVNLTRLLENVVEDARAQAANLTIAATLEPDLHVPGEPDLLEPALQNLVTNAIKYNEPGGQVRIVLAREAERAVVRVSNTGPRIPPEDRERVFERFYRADPSRSRRVDGVGLGLSLAREILRAHGGNLVLDPASGPLTTFVATLPTQPSAAGESPR